MFKFMSVAGALLASAAQGTQIQREHSPASSTFDKVKTWIQNRVQQDDAPTMAQLIQGVQQPVTVASLMALRGAGPELLPIGEGAYQSAEAVKQRTKDTRMECEKSEIYFRAHWAECYKYQGDFVDGPTHGFRKIAAGAIGNKHAIDHDADSAGSSSDSASSASTEPEPAQRSGAASKSVVCTTALAVAVMLRGF
eukprot:TRINITY_DN74403_c0_g1_i1.p1 TRINITY_DN74403_c0_g1~~TRINITY_DN74403_c0_g1_i1.p1  ORF type:complete len:195 (-),score=56.88 TRINITY_DN74403_c0_g1_i1:160-744(-)